MTKLDASAVKCHVFTFKEGLLSAVAHDLKLDVTKLSVDFDPESKSIQAVFDATSLRVLCAIKDGQERPDTLSAKDKRDIEDNMAKDVLVTKKHRESRFRSRSVTPVGSGYRVVGTLEIRGNAREIAFDARTVGDDVRVDTRLHQSDFGVKPFSAMLGTIKIKPEIEVRVTVPRKLVVQEG
jgi:hypothetical protein